MKVPKVTSIVLVVLISLTLLNFIIKYYTYFFLILSSTKSGTDVNKLTEETGEIPHPHELYVPLLTFIPTKSAVLTRPWVIVTAGFIEENFFGLASSVVLIFYLGKYIENIWGSKEFSRFIIINVIATNLVVYFYYRIKSIFIELNEVPPVVLSAMAINMGLLVSIKQRIGNHYIILFKGNLRVKVKFLPFIVILTCFILQLISEEFKISWLLSLFGIFINWTYLRFFKSGTNESKSYLLPFYGKKNKKQLESLHLDNPGIKGDRSESFSFYTFFPYPLSLIIKLISSLVFTCLLKLGYVDPKHFGSSDDENEVDYVQQDINNLQSQFIGLSTLKGAGKVSTIPQASVTFNRFWNWLSKSGTGKNSIKSSMDKRRKLALRELD